MTRGITRREKREMLKQENIFFGLLRIQRHFFPDLIHVMRHVKDPRTGHVRYPSEVLLWRGLIRNAAGLASMRESGRKLNTEECISNLYRAACLPPKEELPHYDTENDWLERLDPREIERIRTYLIKRLLSSRALSKYRLFGRYWCIAFDGTGLYHFHEKHCGHCLRQEQTDPKTGEKKTVYLHHVLEAKLLCGGMALSMGSEFIENEREDVTKQDCEQKAFRRLAAKLKKEYPRLPVCITADSLYACGPVFDLCEEYGWKWIVRFKEGSMPSAAEEARGLWKAGAWENSRETDIWHVNGVTAGRRSVNMVYSKETRRAAHGAEKEVSFLYMTSLPVTRNRAPELERAGRSRWRIENEGFNRQKKYRCYIEHVFSRNCRAMKNHYLLAQTAEILMQLYENSAELLKRIPAGVKEISSLLLESLCTRFLTEEDISTLHEPVQIRFV